MTKSEWLACTQPRWMLRALRKGGNEMYAGWFSCQPQLPRPWRLFVFACAQRVMVRLPVRLAQRVLEFTEQYTEHPPVDHSPLREFYELSPSRAFQLLAQSLTSAPAAAVGVLRVLAGKLAKRSAATPAARVQAERTAMVREQIAQSDLLRDIFGAPGEVVHIHSDWQTPMVKAIASVIDVEGRFAEMPILGDALEDAGCTEEEVLAHCRSGRDHARGCYVLEAILRD